MKKIIGYTFIISIFFFAASFIQFVLAAGSIDFSSFSVIQWIMQIMYWLFTLSAALIVVEKEFKPSKSESNKYPQTF